MYIDNHLLDILISTLKIEYNGTHNSDPESPLWGRRAYWRVYLADGSYSAKITAPVKSINPRPATLAKLFRAELKRRIESIHERCTTDHYGNIQIEYRDPCSVKRIVESITNKYVDIHFRDTHRRLLNEGA
jgi:hypothetical protein